MKTGIVIAIAKELAAFLNGRFVTEEIRDGGRVVYHAKTGDGDVYAVQSGCGKIDAAAATQYLVTAFGVDRIFNYGVTGALERGLKVDDLFVASRTLNYEYDVSEVDPVAPNQYAEFPGPFMPLDAGLIADALRVCPGLKTAAVATGDRFVSDREFKKHLAGLGCSLCDMELAAVVRTAFLNGVPVLSIKCISDTFDGDGGDFLRNVEKSAAKAFEVMEKLLVSV